MLGLGFYEITITLVFALHVGFIPSSSVVVAVRPWLLKLTNGLPFLFFPSWPRNSLFSVWCITVYVFSLLLADGAIAQETIRIRSHEFRPDDVTVGDAFELELRLEADEDVQIYPDAMEVSHIEHIECDAPQIKRMALEPQANGKVRYEVIYPLRAFSPGTHTLPPITIRYTHTGADETTIQTAAYSFAVRSVKPPGPGALRGIKPPFSTPQGLLPYLLAILLMSAIIGGGILLHRRIQAKSTPLAETLAQRPPHEIAHEQLNRIDSRNLVTAGQMKAYYTRMSQVIRQYIAARYNIPAPELTTADLLAHLRSEGIQDEHYTLIADFLGNCDLVKFARYSSTQDTAAERMVEARRIVDATKPLRTDNPTAAEGQIRV